MQPLRYVFENASTPQLFMPSLRNSDNKKQSTGNKNIDITSESGQKLQKYN